MALLDSLARYLSTVPGVGTYDSVGSAGNLFYPEMPDAPPSCLAIRPYGGQPPGPRTFETRVPTWDAPLMQIVSRDPSYDVADARAQAAYVALSSVAGVMFGAQYCYGITCLQPPSNALGRDDNNNWLVSFNVAVVKSVT